MCKLYLPKSDIECDVGGDDCTRISKSTKKLENKLIPEKKAFRKTSMIIFVYSERHDKPIIGLGTGNNRRYTLKHPHSSYIPYVSISLFALEDCVYCVLSEVVEYGIFR